MVEKGALNMDDVKIIWKSSLIPNGPEVIRKDLPEGFKKAYTELMVRLPEADPECFHKIQGGDFIALAPMPDGFFDKVIARRKQQDAGRRG